jgi:CheY-like chemotaxis protein
MPCILVVDDDRSVLETLVDVLRDAGYTTRTSRDGQQALEELRRELPDLLLCDVLLPKLTGFALLEQLRAEPRTRELPVILMSGVYRARNHRAEMTTRHQAIEYLDKPLATKSLLELCARVLGEPAPAGDRTAVHPQLVFDAPGSVPERLIDSAARAERQEVEQEVGREFDTAVLLLQGSLAQQALPSLLGTLWRERRHGALLLRRRGVRKIVYLKHGSPLLVRSNQVCECLGQILVRERLISVDDCASSVERMRHDSRRQGEILVEMGCLSKRNLAFALQLQLETKLFEDFGWTSGDFRFSTGVEPPPGPHFAAPAPLLILDGIRRVLDEARLRELLEPSLDLLLRPRRVNIAWEPLGFSDNEVRALESIRWPLPARALLEALPVGPADALRLTYSLLALQACQPPRAAG